MELLLNLVWLMLAVGALVAFLRVQPASAEMARVSCRKSLLALACVLVLLFPIVSASDDLHPTQAVMEDVSKRGQLAAAPLNLLRTSPPPSMLAATLALCLICVPVVLRSLHPLVLKVHVLDGTTVASAGRAPPSCWN